MKTKVSWRTRVTETFNGLHDFSFVVNLIIELLLTLTYCTKTKYSNQNQFLYCFGFNPCTPRRNFWIFYQIVQSID